MSAERILLVEDDTALRHLLEDELETEGYQIEAVGSAEDAVSALHSCLPDLIISDLRLPGANGLSLLEAIDDFNPRPLLMFITAFGSVRQAVEALKAGANEFMTKPLDMDHLLMNVQRLLEGRQLQYQLQQYQQQLAQDDFHGMIANSLVMHNLRSALLRIAAADGPVLIQGESGTGKELVARALHEESPRAAAPYLAVNCGGIPSELMESEFFGHIAGAFTGARQQRPGLFQQAQGGTLLLDEVGEMPLSLQAKLLRVLQDGEVRPVGSDTATHVDLRIIAATNRDLRQAVAEGTFREDLFFRLETFNLEIPPLRERGEDVLLLANHFLARFSARRHTRIRGFNDEALDILRRYPFPGNIRELENAIERAVTFCDEDIIKAEHLPSRLQKTAASAADTETAFPDTLLGFSSENGLPSLEQVQMRYARYVLEHTEGNKRQAAAILGITRRTLYRWLDSKDFHSEPDQHN